MSDNYNDLLNSELTKRALADIRAWKLYGHELG
jgi:hypothetical protein